MSRFALGEDTETSCINFLLTMKIRLTAGPVFLGVVCAFEAHHWSHPTWPSTRLSVLSLL